MGAVALAAIGVLQMARSSRKWPTAEGRVLRPEEIKAAGTLPYSFAFEYTVGGTRFISGTVELFASKEGARGLSKSSARFTGRRVLQPDGATPRDAYSWRIEAALWGLR